MSLSPNWAKNIYLLINPVDFDGIIQMQQAKHKFNCLLSWGHISGLNGLQNLKQP